MLNSWKKLKRSGSYHRNIKKGREKFMKRAYEIRDELNKTNVVRPIPTVPSMAVINSQQHQQIFIRNEYHYSHQPPTTTSNINNYYHHGDLDNNLSTNAEGVFCVCVNLF